MIHCKPLAGKLTLLLLIFFTFSFKNIVSAQAGDVAAGKALFLSKCASCHNIFKETAYPMLAGLEERHKWADHKELLKWVNNPAAYIAADKTGYTPGLLAKFQSMMTAFPDLTLKDVDDIVAHVNNEVVNQSKKPEGGQEETTARKDGSNAVIFGVISLILAIIALILMQVNSNLKKMSDDAEGIRRPEPVPFYRNKVYIAMLALILFAVGGYYVTKGAIGFGRQKGYQPVQPIYYSHKVHAGINQISCLYCHGSAWESKTAGIPAVNICMNCHKAVTTYEGPKLYDENGDEVNGTYELEKLFKYAGFDPKNPTRWDPSKAKPIEWVKIHNLPDHVYFNHSQHIRAGKVACQTCHGEITAMDEVKQVSELSMGWCVNCHRETKIDFNYTDSTGNKFYSIYEKFHNDIKNKKMDSLTVKDIGGLECQKCHY